MAFNERHLEKFLRLASQRALEDDLQPAPQLVRLFRSTARSPASQKTRGTSAAGEQCAGRLDVLHQSPQFSERVLIGVAVSRDDRTPAPFDDLPQTSRRPGLIRGLVVVAVLPIPLVDVRKNFVRLVDHDEVERVRRL